MTNLQDFCGSKNASQFVLWNNGDFGECFKLLCLVCPANFLLVCSSIFFARRKWQTFEFLQHHLYLLTKLQALICGLIFLEALIEVSCSWSLRTSPSLSIIVLLNCLSLDFKCIYSVEKQTGLYFKTVLPCCSRGIHTIGFPYELCSSVLCFP